VAARASAPEPVTDLWQRIRSQLTWQSIHNAQVGKARDRFLAQPDYLPVVAGRAGLYLYYIVEEVERRGLPMEIALLPLVESTLDPFAVSPERAAGLWQIMPATGRHLGLEQDWWYDGRQDLRDSTRVALDYLESLHQQFDQDWLLALAAYNSGKGRVARAQKANRKKGLATDYWSLKLPRETRHYVPKLIALTQIISYPEAFAVEIPPVANRPAFEVAQTGGQLELLRAAELAGIELTELRALNPGQLRWATAPDMPPELLLPVGVAERFEQGVAQLTPDDRVRWQRYRIERGDSLIRIAKKFDTEVGLLREVNGVRGSMIRAGDILMIPEGSAWSSSLAMATADKPRARGYRVRRGDSLYRIAGKFNVSISDIIDWNALDPDKYLQPGQRLTLYLGGG
jgi:membrane-bound lytic murein transglycosylase D